MFKHKILIVCSGLLFFTSSLFSQSIGIKAGPVYNHFMSSQQHVKGNIGFVGGVSFNYGFSEKLGLSTGLEYLQLGGGILTVEDDSRYGAEPSKNPFATQIRDSKVTLHTVNLPLILKYGIVSGNSGDITIGIGPEASYTIYGSSYDIITLPYGGSNYWVTYTQTINETNNYAPFNVAATALLGFNFMAGNSPISIDFRYRFGALPIRTGYSYLDLFDTKSDMYQGSLIATVEYKFNLTTTD